MVEIEGAIVRQFQSPAATITPNEISIFPRRGLKLTYYSPSFSAIFGFTFSNKVLSPDIYGAHWVVLTSSLALSCFKQAHKCEQQYV